MVNDRQNSVKGRANADRNNDLPATTPHSHTSHTWSYSIHIAYMHHSPSNYFWESISTCFKANCQRWSWTLKMGRINLSPAAAAQCSIYAWKQPSVGYSVFKPSCSMEELFSMCGVTVYGKGNLHWDSGRATLPLLLCHPLLIPLTMFHSQLCSSLAPDQGLLFHFFTISACCPTTVFFGQLITIRESWGSLLYIIQ